MPGCRPFIPPTPQTQSGVRRCEPVPRNGIQPAAAGSIRRRRGRDRRRAGRSAQSGPTRHRAVCGRHGRPTEETSTTTSFARSGYERRLKTFRISIWQATKKPPRLPFRTAIWKEFADWAGRLRPRSPAGAEGIRRQRTECQHDGTNACEDRVKTCEQLRNIVDTL